MTLKETLTHYLPQEFIGKMSGTVNYYTLGPAIGMTPQTVHLWLVSDKIPLTAVKKLMNIADSSLTLDHLRPFCTDLDFVLDQVEKEQAQKDQ